MTYGVSRGLLGALVLGTLTTFANGFVGASAQAAGAGPIPATPAPARVGAVLCPDDLTSAAPVPVLLVPGTGVSAQENWASTYRPALEARGHAVCTVDLPAYGTSDVQAHIEYVASAITTVRRLAGRPIAVLGHSQGAYLPRAALRLWPTLAGSVDDVIGLAGVYDAGSAALAERCAVECVGALHQLATGSAMLAAVARRPLPSGPSYTNVGTDDDLTITPQPIANHQSGALAIAVQDVCPGREVPVGHAMIVGDAVAFALVTDALDHAGTAAVERMSPETLCHATTYPGFDPAPYWGAPTGPRLRTKVAREPALRCYLRADCRDVDSRGALLGAVRIGVTGTTATLRTTATTSGHVRLVLPRRSVVRPVAAGPSTLRFRLPRGRYPIRFETRPRYYSAWATERSRRVSIG